MVDRGKTALTRDYKTSYNVLFQKLQLSTFTIIYAQGQSLCFLYYHTHRAWTMPDTQQVFNTGWMNYLYISYKYHSAKSRDSFLTTLEVKWKKETATLALILRTPFPYSLPSNSQNQGSRQADKSRLFQKRRFRGSKYKGIFWGIRIILTSVCLDHNGYWQKG